MRWGDQLERHQPVARPGEIVGLGGLDGQGQQEVLLAIAGVLRGISGTVRINGRPAVHSGPKGAKGPDMRIALIPEDRKTQGLFLSLSVRDNLTVSMLDRISRYAVVDRLQQAALVERLIDLLKIKAESAEVAVGTLSGGNQQKVVLAKWLATDPKLLLLMDPTRGIDVGTKQEIYRLLRHLADDGIAILFYSTDYDELIGLCDRALIIYDGRVASSLSGPALNEHNILSSALNLSHPAPSGILTQLDVVLAEGVA